MYDPNTLMLAEKLARHFCNTRMTVGLKQTKPLRYSTFEMMKRGDQRVLIETFAAILTVSEDLQLKENLSKVQR